MYSQGVEDQNYLRGVQVADADGVVTFTSIFPACYAGRWPHIHFEVYPDQAGITDAQRHRHLAGRPAEDVCDAGLRAARLRGLGQRTCRR